MTCPLSLKVTYTNKRGASTLSTLKDVGALVRQLQRLTSLSLGLIQRLNP